MSRRAITHYEVAKYITVDEHSRVPEMQIISKQPIERVGKAMLPMYAMMLVGLMLVTFIPQISMALPSMMGLAQ